MTHIIRRMWTAKLLYLVADTSLKAENFTIREEMIFSIFRGFLSSLAFRIGKGKKQPHLEVNARKIRDFCISSVPIAQSN